MTLLGWVCHDCPEGGEDANWAHADAAAEKHTKTTKHSTTTSTVGSLRERIGGRAVDKRPGRQE